LSKSSQEPPIPNGFRDLNVSELTLAAVDKAGYFEPTPIQSGVIPHALEGVDVLAQARTGTGKTAAFAIPLLEAVDRDRGGSLPHSLVLVPTRELAVQVRDEVAKLAYGRKTRSVAVYGGKPIRGQIDKLSRGAHIVVGTPGRVLDHMSRGTLVLGGLRCVVLDEADRMLDIGFRPDIEKILRRCPASRQTLLLSATVPPPVERLARRYMRDPVSLDYSLREVSVETIKQSYFTVSPEKKFELLTRLLQREQPEQAIIFCRTKRGTERVYRNLQRKLKGVDCIHGDLAQSARDRAMASFRDGKVRYLVATDVVGRGIDVSRISHIINFDIPQFCDDYVHRVGRTGRMGREGIAFTFVTPEEGPELTRIEIRIDRLLDRDEIPGFEAVSKRQPGPTETSPMTGVAPEPVQEAPKKPTGAPLLGRRAPRRNRRAL